MSIIASELKAYRSALVNDSASNGGRLSSVQIVSGQLAGLFPNVTPAERTAGITRYRKLFLKCANIDNLALLAPKVFQTKNTPANDRVVFFPGTQRDTQSNLTGSERKYGMGILQANVSAGATTCVVQVEDGAQNLFLNGDKVRLSNQATVGGAGVEEFITLSTAPSLAGNNLTLTFTGTPLVNSFLASNTIASSVYEPVDVKATISAWALTSTGGSFNSGANPVVPDAIGSVEQTWTAVFVSPTAYNLTGDTVGSVGVGSVTSDFTPLNPAFGKPFLKVPFAGFSGVFQTGDTFTVQTHPAAVPIWLREIVPAGSAAVASNTAQISMSGDTA